MTEVINLERTRASSTRGQPSSGRGDPPAAPARRSFAERSIRRAGFYLFAGLAAALIASTWLMSLLAAQACAAALWCEARR